MDRHTDRETGGRVVFLTDGWTGRQTGQQTEGGRSR